MSGDKAIQRAEVLLIKRESLATDINNIAEFIAKAGYRVEVADDYDDAMSVINEDHPHLIVIIWNKSTSVSDDSFMLFRMMTMLPIIVIGDDEYAVEMLENGADAFIAKKEIPHILVAKIRSLLRRNSGYITKMNLD